MVSQPSGCPSCCVAFSAFTSALGWFRTRETPASQAMSSQAMAMSNDQSELRGTPASHAVSNDPSESTASEFLLRVAKLDGEEFSVTAQTGDKISDIVARLSVLCGAEAYRIQLLSGPRVLKAAETVKDALPDLDTACQLTLLLGSHCPAFARELGLTAHHPSLLREWYAKAGKEEPEWLGSDETIWEKFESVLLARERCRETLSAWQATAFLSTSTGEACSILHASAGEAVQCRARVMVHNKDADSCIHQVILALDSQEVAALYNGVPGRGRDQSKLVDFAAPTEPGPYMLWTYSDLQYSMEDARQNFQRGHGSKLNDWYPGSFVGWLVVSQ